MKKYIFIVILLLVCSGLFANNIISIPYMSKPNIDGKINSDEWKNATCVTGFHMLGGHIQEKEKTYIYIGYDNENLYYAFKCYGVNMPIGLEEKPDKSYWDDDAIEFFLTSDLSQKIYFQFVSNCRGGFVSISNSGKGDALKDARSVTIDLDYNIKTYISPSFEKIGAKPEDLFWEGEVSVSWKSLEIEPTDGKEFTLNICRDKVADYRGNSGLAYTLKSFYEFEKFAKATLVKDQPNIQMLHSKIIGGDLNIINNTNREENLIIENNLFEYKKLSKTIKENITLKPNEKYIYNIKDFPKGIYDVETRVIKDNKPFFKVENEVVNTNIFTYNYNKENHKLTFDLDFKGINAVGYPFTDIRLMKGKDMIAGYMLTLDGKRENAHYEIDTTDLKGDFEIVCYIKNVIDEKYNITIN